MDPSSTKGRPPTNPRRFRWRRLVGGLLGVWLVVAGSWLGSRPPRRLELSALGWLTATNGTPVLRLRLTNGTVHPRFVVDTTDRRLHIGLEMAEGHWSDPASIANSLTLAVPAGGWLDVDVPSAALKPPVRAQCVVRERLPEGWLRVVSMLPGAMTKDWLLQGLNRVYRPEPFWTDWIPAPAPSQAGDRASRGGLVFTVTPAATGPQIVRRSLPFEPGLLATNRALRVSDGRREVEAGVRVLTWHPAIDGREPSVRRALVTFVHEFRDLEPVRFVARPAAVPEGRSSTPWPVVVELGGEPGGGDGSLTVRYRGGPHLEARLVAPPRVVPAGPVRIEEIEANPFHRWRRFHLPDPDWPRIVEVREDALGGVIVVAHVQRRLDGDGRAPDLGWELRGTGADARWDDPRGPGLRPFTNGAPAALLLAGDRFRLVHPTAPGKRRGSAELVPSENPGVGSGGIYRFRRCRGTERVPWQSMAWERFEFVVAPAGYAPPTATLEAPHSVAVEPRLWELLYGVESAPAAFAEPRFAALLAFHREAIVRSLAVGDDWGNVTGFDHGRTTGGVMGMNRLNHAPAIFAEGWRSGDPRLREVGLLWCENFHDRSIWWGPNQTGGTRYNNIRAQGRTPPEDDAGYLWRSNDSVNFCTKGYDAFFLAWEETGDPRFREALDAQVAYAREHLHTDRGECRNIGDARDFEQLYRWTGDPRYRAEALRLFRELRTKLSTGDLFDQGGKPLAEDPPFIEEDAAGLKVGYAKPYIIGYALAGLPDLALAEPAEPRLTDVVRAVADFLAASQDPLGAWRYPHPQSSRIILSQAMEHAWQLVQAGRRLGPREAHLDAIERVLRQRLHGWERTGKILSGLSGWEFATGSAKSSDDLYRMYAKPADRDAARDYTEGLPDAGSSPPEGIVYCSEVLAYYLKHRPADGLLRPPGADEPLGKVLARLPETAR
jgi:hypothetical protein